MTAVGARPFVSVGALSYDSEANRLFKYGRPITLGAAPLRLLAFLMEHAGRSFETDDLVARVWGNQVRPDDRARAVVRSQVRRIRLAIEDDVGPWLVSEGSGRGYGLWVHPPVVSAEHLRARHSVN